MFKVDELPVRRRAWVQAAGIPKARLGWEFSECTDVTIQDLEKIKRWIHKLQSGDIIMADGKPTCGKGLLLVGKPGQGKTALSLTIIQEIMRTFSPETFAIEQDTAIIKPCYFTTFSSIIALNGLLIGKTNTDEDERLFLGLHGECKHDAYNVRVLVIDDVGKEHSSASGWNSTVLHHLLRTRFNNGLPTIVTTNIPIKSWESEYGVATGSFIHEAFATIELESIRGDLRK
jgi:DNA replication protein DnaC